MALLSPQAIPVTGIELTFAAAAAGGDTIRPDDGLVLAVTNAAGGARTVTLVRPGSEYGQANPDVANTIAAGDTEYMRVPRQFADPSTGLINVTYSDAAADLSVALMRI